MSTHTRSLGSDNHNGIHPKILQAILDANEGHAHSYGKDPWTTETDRLFRKTFGDETRSFYLFNGTATNVLCLDSLVRSHQSVLCAETSHLWQDECGAPQRLIGCQVVPVAARNGKLTPDSLREHIGRLGDQHASQPGAFSITQPTELGTVYSLDELKDLAEFARENNLYFHMDGARITNAAAALGTTLAKTTFEAGIDALSFGGTKHGLMQAEAVIFRNSDLAEGFRYRRKQAMQLPSKTRFIAAQFQAFLKDELWRDIALHANRKAAELRSIASQHPGIGFPYSTDASCVFATIPKAWLKPLRKSRFFYVWDPKTMLVRWSTGFDTTEQDIQEFSGALSALGTARG